MHFHICQVDRRAVVGEQELSDEGLIVAIRFAATDAECAEELEVIGILVCGQQLNDPLDLDISKLGDDQHVVKDQLVEHRLNFHLGPKQTPQERHVAAHVPIILTSIAFEKRAQHPENVHLSNAPWADSNVSTITVDYTGERRGGGGGERGS